MPRIGKFVVFIGAFAMLASACSKGGGTITINREKANDHGTKTSPALSRPQADGRTTR